MNKYNPEHSSDELYRKMRDEKHKPTIDELKQLFRNILTEPKEAGSEDRHDRPLQAGWEHMTESRGWK